MTTIKSMIIIEMMGRPAEHLKKVMKDYVGRIDGEKGIKVLDKKLHKPKEVEQKNKEGEEVVIPGNKELFSTFAEIEFEAETVFDLMRIVFTYMPSHIEIIQPEELKMQNIEFAGLFNDITRKLHQYDAIAKNALMQNQMLANKILQMKEALGQRLASYPPQQMQVPQSKTIKKKSGKKIKKTKKK